MSGRSRWRCAIIRLRESPGTRVALLMAQSPRSDWRCVSINLGIANWKICLMETRQFKKTKQKFFAVAWRGLPAYSMEVHPTKLQRKDFFIAFAAVCALYLRCMCGYRRSLKYFSVLQFNKKKMTLVILDSNSRERLEWFNSLSHNITLWKRFAVVFYRHFKKYRLSLARTRLMCALLPPSSRSHLQRHARYLLHPLTWRQRVFVNSSYLSRPQSPFRRELISLSPWESALIVCAQYFFLLLTFLRHFPPSWRNPAWLIVHSELTQSYGGLSLFRRPSLTAST